MNIIDVQQVKVSQLFFAEKLLSVTLSLQLYVIRCCYKAVANPLTTQSVTLFLPFAALLSFASKAIAVRVYGRINRNV